VTYRNIMTYRMTKTYGHELGLSAIFRQPDATSHCREPHGYALGFKLVFEARRLDANGWVKDFGGLKPLKQRLVDNFDHRLSLATYDPALADFQALYAKWGWTPPLVVPKVGCESFARLVWGWADQLITAEERARGVRLVEVECREHAGNAASYLGNG
jgi:6-pyruvoyltetrahydropterin/6-carboxytetrahydropterin synthase